MKRQNVLQWELQRLSPFPFYKISSVTLFNFHRNTCLSNEHTLSQTAPWSTKRIPCNCCAPACPVQVHLLHIFNEHKHVHKHTHTHLFGFTDDFGVVFLSDWRHFDLLPGSVIGAISVFGGVFVLGVGFLLQRSLALFQTQTLNFETWTKREARDMESFAWFDIHNIVTPLSLLYGGLFTESAIRDLTPVSHVTCIIPTALSTNLWNDPGAVTKEDQ